MVKVENLSKSFGQIKALDNLSFEIGRGEVVGLLGPNGAGKTTTMRLLTGFLLPDQGQVMVGGVDVARNPELAQEQIGYLPEENPLYKGMLVSEFLDLSASLNDLSRVKRRQALDLTVPALGLADYYYRPISELSKGYRQRVGLAAALLSHPRVLILDEPTEGLDPNQRAEIRGLIKEIGQERTVIMSTHVMQEVSAICSRILIINNGELVADGTPDELSRGAQKERVLLAEIEGASVISLLEDRTEVTRLEILAESSNWAKLRLFAESEVELQPMLSQLAREKNWVIWHLTEEKKDLEDLFKEITSPSSSTALAEGRFPARHSDV